MFRMGKCISSLHLSYPQRAQRMPILSLRSRDLGTHLSQAYPSPPVLHTYICLFPKSLECFSSENFPTAPLVNDDSPRPCAYAHPHTDHVRLQCSIPFVFVRLLLLRTSYIVFICHLQSLFSEQNM